MVEIITSVHQTHPEEVEREMGKETFCTGQLSCATNSSVTRQTFWKNDFNIVSQLKFLQAYRISNNKSKFHMQLDFFQTHRFSALGCPAIRHVAVQLIHRSLALI